MVLFYLHLGFLILRYLMTKVKESHDVSRRDFLRNVGRALTVCAVGGLGYRLLGSSDSNAPKTRYAWQINEQTCTSCGACETACVRTPSAVKAVNDQQKCSFCVVCYGHIEDKSISSDKIMTEGKFICPRNAVTRTNYSGGNDGTFIYDVDHKKCVGCGQCTKACNEHGSKSMFLIIRPDLCLGCNQCAIASACPSKSIDRLHPGMEDNFRGEYGLDGDMGNW